MPGVSPHIFDLYYGGGIGSSKKGWYLDELIGQRKVSSTCAKKLHYKKFGYPSNLEENGFMKMLAEGGYIIGKLATLLYPGVEIKGSTFEALEQIEIKKNLSQLQMK